jgi:hypothetical protein
MRMESTILDQRPQRTVFNSQSAWLIRTPLRKVRQSREFPNANFGHFLQPTIVLWIYLVRIYTTKAPPSLGREA